MTFFSAMIIPIIISIVLFIGLKEKKNVYDIFVDGAKEGIKITLKLFPTMIGIFLAIYMLRSSGFIDFLVNIFSNVTKFFSIPSEVLPLMLIKPISGSGSMAIATELMTKFGPDSNIGMIAATIMASSETTFYVIALYMSQSKVKNSRKIVIPALLADFAVNFVQSLFNFYFKVILFCIFFLFVHLCQAGELLQMHKYQNRGVPWGCRRWNCRPYPVA